MGSARSECDVATSEYSQDLDGRWAAVPRVHRAATATVSSTSHHGALRMARRRVVVLRPGALGDTIVTLDSLAALRRGFPDAVLELVGNREAGTLLQEARVVDIVRSFDGPEVASLFLQPPTVPAVWGKLELAVIWLRAGARVADAFVAAGARRIICASPEPPLAIHVSDHLVATLAPLDLPAPAPAAPALLLHRNSEEASGEPAARILLHPGSGSDRKNWPAAAFGALARRLFEAGHSVAFLRGPADGASVAAVQTAFGESLPVTRDPLSLRELRAVIAAYDVYVGNDSGVTQLSARLGVPTVAVFGPTDPRQWAPRGPRVAVVAGRAWPTVGGVWDVVQRLVDECSAGMPGRALQEKGRDEQRGEEQDGDSVDHQHLPKKHLPV
ncbi:MAG: hypothetical protein GEU73_13735 [Chloroflexi bacterium]|nr:hypothetical protein [Chloroflexota bacterium]